MVGDNLRETTSSTGGVVIDSSIETFIRSILNNEELDIEKTFNEKVKKETKIYNVIEPDTLKSVLETDNTLVSIVYSTNREFAT